MVEMQSKKLMGSKPGTATQKYLDIAEIREDTIILNDGSLRAVLAVSSTNFSLKSEDEQKAITGSYQSFLNSLDFPIQILVHSRVLDIEGYLEKLKLLASSQTNELLRIQMQEYIEFVSKLISYASIMSKTFYVVVPYSGGKPVKEGFLSKLGRLFNPTKSIKQSQKQFEQNKRKLEDRLSHVESGLSSMSLRNIRLKTDELIELMYNSYNFESASPLHAESLEGIEVEDLEGVEQKT